jgi:hypothetical protein
MGISYNAYDNRVIEITPELTPEDYSELTKLLEESSDWTLEDDEFLIVEEWYNCSPHEELNDLIEKFFKPRGYVLSGEIPWNSDGCVDFNGGTIYVSDNVAEEVCDEEINPGPSWDSRHVIVVTVEGGVVQAVCATKEIRHLVAVYVKDYDVDSDTEKHLDPEGNECYLAEYNVEELPEQDHPKKLAKKE